MKEYEEPEPDYPQDDSPEPMRSAVQGTAELRLFDSTDLPPHRGDFTSQHSIMVRSRQMAEIAGLMDGSQADQPTLKRFSRYNQSMYSRPSSTCDDEPSSSHLPQSQTYSKGGKLKTGIFSGNWTLRDKKEMRPSVHNITVVPIGRQVSSTSGNSHTPAITPHTSSSASLSSLQLRLPKQNSPTRERRLISADTFVPDERLSPTRRREPSATYSRRGSASVRRILSLLRSATSQCANDSVRNSSLAAECSGDLVDGCCAWNQEAAKQRSATRERVIPIEIKPASNDRSSKEDPQTTVKTRKIPVQIRIEEPVKSTILDNRCRPISFPAAMFKKSGSCDDIVDECDDTQRIVNKRNHSEATHEVLGSGENETLGDGADEFDEDELRPIDEDLQCCRLRRIGGVKSVGPTRRRWHRPVVEVFPCAHTRSVSKDSGIASTAVEQRHSNCSSSTDDHSPTASPIIEGFATHLVIDADSAYRTGTSDSSPSSVSSCSETQSPAMRKSCPDLRQAAIVQPKNLEAHRVHNPRVRRAREKRQAAEWMKKPVNEWSFDDVLVWLQHCKLDEVASVMIGYDITGSDVDKWNDETLVHLGVVDESVRREVLKNLADAKEAYQKKVDDRGDKTSRGRQRMPLFKMVRSASYDKVLALETSLTTRDITVAEGRFGCLQVTKVNGANIPLKEQDCLLEINEKPGQLFRSPLMFTKLVSDAAGEPIRLVVLRRRLPGDADDDDDDERNRNNVSSSLPKTTENAEQHSSASSGVSSSEISSEVAAPISALVEHNPEVLRL